MLSIATSEERSQIIGKNALNTFYEKLFLEVRELVLDNRNRDLYSILDERRKSHPNPLTKFGRKCFSQTDEDGITIEICRRLKIDNGYFAEFGVGDGLENNTLILLALGWSGFWVDGQNLAYDLSDSKRLSFQKSWITKDNIISLWHRGIEKYGIKDVDIISIDLDGNDYYLIKAILAEGVRPKLFIVEYNAKFPPPIEFIISYDEKHEWNHNDYFGASLQSFSILFKDHEYSLVCCNAATGCNAFFVRDEFIELFSDVPADIANIYVAPFYFLFDDYGHKKSIKTVLRIIND